MGLARLHSCAFVGVDAIAVDVEVNVKREDKFSLVLVGLPDLAVKESKDRVLTALGNGGFRVDGCQCIVNLAPGDLKKEGVLYDLPIALGLLCAQGLLSAEKLSSFLCIGELSLGGELRPIRGALSAALLAKQLGKKGILLPKRNAEEAAVVPDIAVLGVETLAEAQRFIQGHLELKATASPSFEKVEGNYAVDFADVKGQLHAKRALEVAAAGGHNVLLYGPPGTGKTLLAKAFPSILPPLSLQEALEVTKIHSLAGLFPPGGGLLKIRPFRAPHHTISQVGLIGGGSIPRPGEISLAHKGVLFLDELPEFSQRTLEVLRQPLENGTVSIARAAGRISFPTQCLFIGAMNPCPCGYLGHPQKACSDTALQIQRYRSRLSGPLLDRIDMHVEMPSLSFEDLTLAQKGTSSATIRERVLKARRRQKERFGVQQTNAQMDTKAVSRFLPLTKTLEGLLGSAMERLRLSARAYHRLLKVARTIADLSESEKIEEEHLLEALSFRSFENTPL